MDKTTLLQMKQLMKKLQGLQLDYMGKIDELFFDVGFKTDDSVSDHLQDSIEVSILANNGINRQFSFYQFLDYNENQATLRCVRMLLRKIESAEIEKKSDL